jgi:UDP-N-acetylmuramoylalanine--D-glutamate ligase
MASYIKVNSRIFRNQQSFDWLIIQSSALKKLTQLGISVPGKRITYSSEDSSADIHLDRGLIISRLSNWAGPLLDTQRCEIRGAHNAENMMAAMAVGHALRLPWGPMVEALTNFRTPPHRLELVRELGGVQYLNDAKSSNLEALRQALVAVRRANDGGRNVILIAGGGDCEECFQRVAQGISQRVKHAFLVDDSAGKLKSAWRLFTPCTEKISLIEAVQEAWRISDPGDVVLFSPGCPIPKKFRNYQQRGEEFCRIVKSIGRGDVGVSPNKKDTFEETLEEKNCYAES